jgi:hypothetical protein
LLLSALPDEQIILITIVARGAMRFLIGFCDTVWKGVRELIP